VPDAHEVYAHGDDRQRKLIASVWPDLGAVMEAARTAAMSTRVTICALAPHAPPVTADGRVTPNGHPACRSCLAGRRAYPLQLQDPREVNP
jgi:hypothetical protein